MWAIVSACQVKPIAGKMRKASPSLTIQIWTYSSWTVRPDGANTNILLST
jgi:hypothetical protein